jgi:pimeloyl-ACP methyl ester carboxylesterase
LSWLNGRDEVLPQLSQIRTEYPDYSLVLVGHSLGGAVAALAGLEFAVRGWEPQVTTFGEPRIGNAAFATYINERFGLEGNNRTALGEGRISSLYHRVTHVNDPVPLLPFEEWGYAPHAGEIYISKVDVPPEVTDVSFCRGNADPACSAGQDAEEQARSVVAAMDADLDSSYEHRPYRVQAQIPISTLAFPSRLKLWELFFAHRDYFSRLGVCLPQFGEGRKNKNGHHDHSRLPGWKWWEKLKKKFRPWVVEG